MPTQNFNVLGTAMSWEYLFWSCFCSQSQGHSQSILESNSFGAQKISPKKIMNQKKFKFVTVLKYIFMHLIHINNS